MNSNAPSAATIALGLGDYLSREILGDDAPVDPEQNLLVDESGEPVNHPQIAEVFGEFLGASYALPDHYRN